MSTISSLLATLAPARSNQPSIIASQRLFALQYLLPPGLLYMVLIARTCRIFNTQTSLKRTLKHACRRRVSCSTILLIQTLITSSSELLGVTQDSSERSMKPPLIALFRIRVSFKTANGSWPKDDAALGRPSVSKRSPTLLLENT